VDARSVKTVLGAVIAAAMIMMVCVARMAIADPAAFTPADFEGRWISEKKKLTLDISRCGDDICGVLVADNACGHTALRVNDKPPKEDFFGRVRPGELFGQLRLAANTEPYGVRAVLSRNPAGAASLSIIGHSGGAYSMARRMYDFRDLLVRDGDATCRPDPKLS
jgi:hypothetical protein